MTTRVVPKTELRDRIREELATLGGDTLLVTDRGRPLAVAVSVDRWNEIQERLEDVEDALAVLEHRAAPKRGRSLESVLKDLESEAAHVRRPSRQAG